MAVRRDAILMYGYPPQQRGGGPNSIVYNLAKELHRAGRDVLFLVADFPSPGANRTLGISVQLAAEPHDPRRMMESFVPLESFAALRSKDALLRLGLAGQTLKRVGIVHSHTSGLVPHYNDWERDPNNYVELRELLRGLTGAPPKFVRTRHEDAQSGMDRFMRFTGIDYFAASPQERRRILNGEVDLEPIVKAHVQSQRAQLKGEGSTDQYLDEAIHHVWWVVHQFRLWRRELRETDAVVSLTRRGQSLMHHATAEGDSPRSVGIRYGIDFCPSDPARLDQLLFGFHYEAGLKCYRAGNEPLERIPFRREDKKVIFVGRNVRDKGIFELAQALGKLYHSGVAVRGIFVGHFEQPLRQAMAELDPVHSPQYLLFTGPVHDTDLLRAIFAFGDVTAIPSHYDPSPLVGMETYLAGTPCVVTEGIGATESYLEYPAQCGDEIALGVRKPHREGLRRFYGVDADHLASQLRQMLMNEPLAWQMAQRGKRFVEERYNAQAMTRKYLHLYDVLQAGQDPAAAADFTFTPSFF